MEEALRELNSLADNLSGALFILLLTLGAFAVTSFIALVGWDLFRSSRDLVAKGQSRAALLWKNFHS